VTSKVYRGISSAIASFNSGASDTLICNDALAVLPKFQKASIDLVFSSPPYCIGKEYESARTSAEFVAIHEKIIPVIVDLLKPGGSFCWQVGYHARKGVLLPLDFLVHEQVRKHPKMMLRNRVIWTFNHGLHASKRFSGRHEIVLWYTKGDSANFDLDSIRIPQKYPGKLHYKGPKKGGLSGNPLGKNPGDVWDVPNVKGKHVEKTSHPCQFPVALPQRFIRALCPKGGVVLDPFMGVGSAGVAAAIESRRFIGIEIDDEYSAIAAQRISEARAGRAVARPDKPVVEPKGHEKVAKRPAHFRG